MLSACKKTTAIAALFSLQLADAKDSMWSGPMDIKTTTQPSWGQPAPATTVAPKYCTCADGLQGDVPASVNPDRCWRGGYVCKGDCCCDDQTPGGLNSDGECYSHATNAKCSSVQTFTEGDCRCFDGSLPIIGRDHHEGCLAEDNSACTCSLQRSPTRNTQIAPAPTPNKGPDVLIFLVLGACGGLAILSALALCVCKEKKGGARPLVAEVAYEEETSEEEVEIVVKEKIKEKEEVKGGRKTRGVKLQEEKIVEKPEIRYEQLVEQPQVRYETVQQVQQPAVRYETVQQVQQVEVPQVTYAAPAVSYAQRQVSQPAAAYETRVVEREVVQPAAYQYAAAATTGGAAVTGYAQQQLIQQGGVAAYSAGGGVGGVQVAGGSVGGIQVAGASVGGVQVLGGGVGGVQTGLVGGGQRVVLREEFIQ